ncbi:hypothetical protein SAMN05216567_121131 [Variovorax sp. OK605]|uniref:bifunctional aminoglycoside phosphotransferase/ATP-binding protein n=1 Tax=Variovorax sp. OK605 TaxID=1855317 RepID=UPI0008E61678|nr:bifunctional aminoglycoside phosphotransferase/ATP-binding protein [Variovorax sp. OK605]SFQ60677.1 hypothetical protein SAMN05216567_121131 [Variovorax sp. OK605]
MDTTLVNALRDLLHRDTGAPVELVETHISWVLLTASHAYKLKKPVRLSFLDFSSLEARKHFCEEELRLNLRFAPSIYLDVVPVCGSRESPQLGLAGAPVDYLVHMRRFAASSLMRELLVSGQIEARQVDALGQRLAQWHAVAPRWRPPPAYGSADLVGQAITDVIASVAACIAPDDEPHLAGVRSWLQQQAGIHRDAWGHRLQRGAVRECHGDLHMANVALVDDLLTPFDCIEFDPALRWIDVMSDVAFLVMDLKAHGHSDLAFRFLDAWLQHSGDYEGLPVLRFYEVYRALVRYMVVGMGPRKSPGPAYLECAARLMRPSSGGPRLLITHGFSGSGKSTIALQLLSATGAIRLRSDVERKRLFGLRPLASSAAQGFDIYGVDATQKTFDRLCACARQVLLAGYPVIVDAAFLRSAERRRFEELARELQLPFTVLHCRASDATLRCRVAQRAAKAADASEAGLEVLAAQLQRHEPLRGDEIEQVIEVMTDRPFDIAALAARWRAARIPDCRS